MTKETDELATHIEQARHEHLEDKTVHEINTGYGTTINVLTDLFGCVLIGLGLGVLFQHLFDTSILLTAGLTILGGIAGLWTVARYGLSIGKKERQHLNDDSQNHAQNKTGYKDETLS